MKTIEVEIPDDLYKAIVAQAEHEGISLDALIERSLRVAIGMPVRGSTVVERASRGSWDDFDRIMARVPDVPPMAGDEPD